MTVIRTIWKFLFLVKFHLCFDEKITLTYPVYVRAHKVNSFPGREVR